MHGIDRGILAGAIVVLGLVSPAQSPLAEDRPSARIYSLGGEVVSGVIPDLYTDLSINPAYAYFADRLTLNYGRRDASGFDMAFPYLSGHYISGSASSFVYGTDEISLYGIRVSGWRMALSAQWQLSQDESTVSLMDIGTGGNEYIAAIRDYASYEKDFGRIDVAAARSIGDRSVFGFRLQGRGYYESHSRIGSRETESYMDFFYADISRKWTQYDADSRLKRQLGLDFQAGVARRDGNEPASELVLQASLRSLDYQKQLYGLDITREYNAAHELDGYWYNNTIWSDKREGVLWVYVLSVRHAFRGDIRVYSGVSLSTASYDAEWIDFNRYIDWDLYSGGKMISGEFAGDGSLWEASYFLKGGKEFSLHETLDLTIGLYGGLQRMHAEEDPVIHYAQSLSGGDTTRIDQPSSLRYRGTRVNIYIPLSIEFRPSSYFSFFSGFTIYGKWRKDVTENPALSLFYCEYPHTSSVPGGASRAGASEHLTVFPEASVANWDRGLYTGNVVTLGFSLHYRDRFFVNVYSNSEIIPSSLGTRTIDVRYAF
jgi:hypothetical protein